MGSERERERERVRTCTASNDGNRNMGKKKHPLRSKRERKQPTRATSLEEKLVRNMASHREKGLNRMK